MAYDFKKLADVSKDDTVPENGNVLYEEDGEIKKAPIKQDKGKKIKYITAFLSMCCSDNGGVIFNQQFCDLFDSDGNITNDENSAAYVNPVFFEGSNIPYMPNSNDYEHLKGSEIIKLYDEGYEIRVCSSVAFMESSTSNTINNNRAPNSLKDMWLNRKVYKGWSPLKLVTSIPYMLSGSDIDLSKEGQTVQYLCDIPYLEDTDGNAHPTIRESESIPLINEDLL